MLFLTCLYASFGQANCFECRNNFQRRIDAHAGEIRAGKLLKLNASYEKKLSEVLSQRVGDLLNEADNLTWPTIRSLLDNETASAVFGMSADLASFDMDEQPKVIMLADMKEYARRVVLLKAKDESEKVLLLMKDRFSKIFSHDNANIPQLSQLARLASLKILVVMAAAPMDDIEDNIMQRFTTLSNETLLNSTTWEQISLLSNILITPYHCHDYWMEFSSTADIIVSKATTALQDAVIRRPGPLEKFLDAFSSGIYIAFGFKKMLDLLDQ